MGVPRFLCQEPFPEADELALPERIAHHAVRVLRLGDGDALVLFDGNGHEAQATLMQQGRSWWARIETVEEVSRECGLDIVLVQALAAADKMDWVVQKAVELGVGAIQPVRAARSVLRLSADRADKRLLHWRQVAVAACEQSGRNRVPDVFPVLGLDAYLASGGKDVSRFVLDPLNGSSLKHLVPPSGPLHLLVGPEGGWSPDELQACLAAACIGVTLGPRVMRTETAGLAAIASVQLLWGDF